MLEGKEDGKTHYGSGKYYKENFIGSNRIEIQGRVQDGETARHNGGGGVNGQPCEVEFEARILVDTDGCIKNKENTLWVEHATYATVYIFGASNVLDYGRLGDTDIRTLRNDAVMKRIYDGRNFLKRYEQIKNRHIEDYRKIYDRSCFELKNSYEVNMPTDERIQHFDGKKDLHLITLFFNYAKYLIIASSRGNETLSFGKLEDKDVDVVIQGQPSTLQGLWNYEYSPEWQSKYTININTEMIYWLSQLTGMWEVETPLVDAIKDLQITGHVILFLTEHMV